MVLGGGLEPAVEKGHGRNDDDDKEDQCRGAPDSTKEHCSPGAFKRGMQCEALRLAQLSRAQKMHLPCLKLFQLMLYHGARATLKWETHILAADHSIIL